MTLLSNEKERLKTFELWPKTFINKKDLASNGFFYLNITDIVQCYYCNIQLSNWQKYDIVLEEHKKYSSNCYIFSEEYRTKDTKNMDVCGTTDRGTRKKLTELPILITNKIKYFYHCISLVGLIFNLISILYILNK